MRTHSSIACVQQIAKFGESYGACVNTICTITQREHIF